MNLAAFCPDNNFYIATADCCLLGYPVELLDDCSEIEPAVRLSYLEDEEASADALPNDANSIANSSFTRPEDQPGSSPGDGEPLLEISGEPRSMSEGPDVSINYVYCGYCNLLPVVGCVDDAGNVVVWKVAVPGKEEERGRGKKILHLNNHRTSSWGLATSRQHPFVAVSGNDHLIRLWNSENPTESFTLRGHSHNIPSICFDPRTGKHLLSTGIDGSVRVWDVFGGGGCLRVVKVPEEDWGWSCMWIEREMIFSRQHAPSTAASSLMLDRFVEAESATSDEGWELAPLESGVFYENITSENALNGGFPSEDVLAGNFDLSFWDGVAAGFAEYEDDSGGSLGESSSESSSYLTVPSSHQPDSMLISAANSVYDEIFESSSSSHSTKSADRNEEDFYDLNLWENESDAKSAPLLPLAGLLMLGTSNYGVFALDPLVKRPLFNRYDLLTRTLSSRQRRFMALTLLRNIVRLNMSFWIPEVSCLVTGSQCGLVVVSLVEKVGESVRLAPLKVLPESEPPLCPLAGVVYYPVVDVDLHVSMCVRLLLIYTDGTLYRCRIRKSADKFLFI